MTPYWLDERGPAFPPVEPAETVDVGIVGAGITGCACALALAEAGLRVRLVDGRRVAEGASGRNGGFALRGTASPYDEVVAAHGRDRALALWQWTEAELRALGALAGPSFRPVGSLRLAADAEEREELRRRDRGAPGRRPRRGMGRRARRAARRTLHGRDPPSHRRRAAARPLGAPARGARRRGGRRDRGGSTGRGPCPAPRRSASSSRRTAIRAACSARSRGSSCRRGGR